MIQNLILQSLAGGIGLWLAVRFVPEVTLIGDPRIFVYAGIALGVMNTIVKPVLNIITFPIRVITLGISSLVVSILMVLAVEIFFIELDIAGLIPLFQTTVIVWGMSLVLNLFGKGKITSSTTA